MKNIAHSFQLYLSETVRVPPHQLRYYLRWVDRFLKPEALMDITASWRVKQACDAVKHYWFWLDRSRSFQENLRISGLQTAGLLDETRRLPRLQNKSYRTEHPV